MKNILKKIGFRYMDLACKFVLGVALVNICLLQPIGILQLVLWLIMKLEIRSMKKEFNAEIKKQKETAETEKTA